MGQNWWWGQDEIGEALVNHDRVAVKGGHGIGKTMLSGGIAPWFFHSFVPSKVITTAPGGEQVRNEIWREIRKSKRDALEPLYDGIKPIEPMWELGSIGPETYMMGMATNDGTRFRGKHGPNMLFIFEEGPGIPRWAWEEADNMCTAPNNKILTIGNPIVLGGTYHECFKPRSGWHCITLSCLDHPNVVEGKQIYPGAVSLPWVLRNIKKHCKPIPGPEGPNDFEFPRGSGQWYSPNAYFCGRVLGVFPDEGPDTLICSSLIQRAIENAQSIDSTTPVDIGMDVARAGGDHCVVFARRGQSLICRRKWMGKDTDKSRRELKHLILELNEMGFHVGTVAIDAIGIGSGLADTLRAEREEGEVQCDRVLCIQVSEKAVNVARYANKRTELAFALKERFLRGEIDLSRLGDAVEDFATQCIGINEEYDKLGRYKLQEKDAIREAIGESPDDFDAMALAFIDTADTFAEDYASLISAS